MPNWPHSGPPRSSRPSLWACCLLVAAAVDGAGIGDAWHTPIHVSPSGADEPSCGAADTPCRTASYAIATVAAALPAGVPIAQVLLAPGLYTSDSCGAVCMRPLNVSGAGQDATVVDCDGASRFLSTTASLAMQRLTVRHAVYRQTVVDAWFSGGGAVSVSITPTAGVTTAFAHFEQVWLCGSLFCDDVCCGRCAVSD
jgi:hypothetical protein